MQSDVSDRSEVPDKTCSPGATRTFAGSPVAVELGTLTLRPLPDTSRRLPHQESPGVGASNGEKERADASRGRRRSPIATDMLYGTLPTIRHLSTHTQTVTGGGDGTRGDGSCGHHGTNGGSHGYPAPHPMCLLFDTGEGVRGR